jgi:hypothetical protein
MPPVRGDQLGDEHLGEQGDDRVVVAGYRTVADTS